MPPSQPTLSVTETGSDWLEIHWNVVDNGGSAIRGYILEYVLFSADSPPWVEVTLPRDKTSYKLVRIMFCVISHKMVVNRFRVSTVHFFHFIHLNE